MRSSSKNYEKVLDIGTDHGLVLKKAFELRYIKKGIASDNKFKPLMQAKKNLKKYYVNFYLSDGFDNIKEDFDLALICGMGVFNIIKILSKAPHKNKHFLLGPQGKIEYLLYWLEENDFEIIEKYHIFDKFDYLFLKVTLKI
ncbi:tRNA (adenine(22)-N(1))-methyltransferase TrmK [Candidatus Phytoplasma mali]|nr:tRNA (adenine(22)-N(1))-methyltransferase TrmK [Candidatus Phytoplasma mali]